MTEQSDKALDARVALRKESVDRNGTPPCPVWP